MDWLTSAEALTATSALEKPITAQMISLVTNLHELNPPIAPEVIPAEGGPPGAQRRWYAQIGDRLITIESETRQTSRNEVLINTFFMKRQDEFGDWSVLLELQELPKSIYVTRPLFVESRHINCTSVVYRPDVSGWNNVIYKAASLPDADAFLAFLRQDQWNDSCFIGEPEPVGKWVMIQEEEVIVGQGPELNIALRFACE